MPPIVLKQVCHLAADHYNSEHQFADGAIRWVRRFYDFGVQPYTDYCYRWMNDLLLP
jgi:hypothetical protein